MSQRPSGTAWNICGTIQNHLHLARWTPAMLHAYKVFLATTYPQHDLIGTMNRFLACLALCASLSASAQDDNCTVLGIQDLTQMVLQLQAQHEIQDAAMLELQADYDLLQSAAMTRDSVFDIAVGVAWRRLLAGADLSDAGLSNVDLLGANLSDADLNNAYLNGTNLTGAILAGADLTGANLHNANLYGSNLISANLSGADLSSATLTWANLTGADLTGATTTCLQGGCPPLLPSGYTCEPDPDCWAAGRIRIVPQ